MTLTRAQKILLIAALTLVAYALARAPILRWAAQAAPGLVGGRGWGLLDERVRGERGRALLQLDRNDEAVTELEASLAVDPHSEFRKDLAFAFMRKGDLERAEKEARRYVDEFSSDGYGYILLGEILSRRGRPAVEIIPLLQDGLKAVRDLLEERRVLRGQPPEYATAKHDYQVKELLRQIDELSKMLTKLGVAPTDDTSP